MLSYPSQLAKYIIKIGKISTKILEIGKKKAISVLVCSFDLILYVPSAIFQFNRNGYS